MNGGGERWGGRSELLSVDVLTVKPRGGPDVKPKLGKLGVGKVCLGTCTTGAVADRCQQETIVSIPSRGTVGAWRAWVGVWVRVWVGAFSLLLLAEEGNGVRAGPVQNSSRRSCAALPAVGAAGILFDRFVMGVMWELVRGLRPACGCCALCCQRKLLISCFQYKLTRG